MKNISKLMCLVAFCPIAVMANVSIYVSPSGNDNDGDGTQGSPYRTLERAKSAVRDVISTTDDRIDVYLDDGTYRLQAPLYFDTQDSPPTNIVSYSAINAGHATISGGIEITGWTDPDENGIWEAEIPNGVYSRQLYVDGSLATRARSVDGTGWRREGEDGIYSAPAYVGEFSNIKDAEIVVQFLWKQYRGRLDSYSDGLVQMNRTFWALARIGPYGILDPSAQHVSWVENAIELLDEEGEWYIDRDAGKLFYMPIAGVDINQSTVILPVTETLINIDSVNGITFNGINFSDTSWLQPSSDTGYVSIQSGSILTDSDYMTIEDGFEGLVDMPAAINTKNSSNIIISNNGFDRIGSSAIHFGTGSKNNTIFRNNFDQISASAVVIGDLQDHHALPQFVASGNVIDNNIIRNTGLDYYDTAAVKHSYVFDNIVSNNTIEFTPYTGISMGWGWTRYDVEPISFPNDFANKGYNSPTVVDNNIVFRNKISEYSSRVGDSGGIYNLGASKGSRLVENLIFDGRSPSEGTHFVNGIYMDNGTRAMQIDRNGVYNVPNHGYFYNAGGNPSGIVYNTLGENVLFDDGSGSAGDMPPYLSDVGFAPSITEIRSHEQITNLLPDRIVDVPDAAMPPFGMLVGYGASASSNTETAVNVIDGNPQTFWAAGDFVNAAEIIIDTELASNMFTGFVIAFGEVVETREVYHRFDRTFTIQLSDDGVDWRVVVDNSTEPSAKRSTFANYIAPQNARFIKVTVNNESGEEALSVLRFKAYGEKGITPPDGDNIALAGEATQSSTIFGNVALIAIDGNRNGDWSLGEVTHTDEEYQPYWTLDLGASYPVNQIRIYNRTDCCSERLSNFYVFYSDVPFTGTTVDDSLTQESVKSVYQRESRHISQFDIFDKARYVRVQLVSELQALSLAEVEVYSGE